MTIKRRLFISNILMILVPIALLILFVGGMGAVMMGVSGHFGGRSFDDERFFSAKNEIEALSENWTQTNGQDDGLLRSVAAILAKYGSDSVAAAVYKYGVPVSVAAPDTPVLKAALEQTGGHMLVFDHTAVFVQKLGAYHVVLTDTNYYLNDDAAYLSQVVIVGAGMLCGMVMIIFFTNRVLTRVMVKSIITPLDTLSYGVEQVREGNLSFRLDYLGKDEFSPVCGAFNQMAERLQKLEESRKLDEESRRELIAGISHDLRTPLSAIKLYLEGIEKNIAATPERKQQYFDTIKSKTEDLEHIIGQLFLFSKLETNDFPVNMKPVNIGQMLAEIVGGLTEEYGRRGLTLTMKQPVPNAVANVDTSLLQRVIVNILENSAKYKTADVGVVSVSVREKNGGIAIRLADDGPGVPADTLHKLFDVFYRADPSRNTKGSGLGLAISAKIIKRMGGGITAEPAAHGGLAIVLRLPAFSDEGGV